MRYSREVLITVLTALAVGVWALPAVADINETGTFEGIAEVGKTFWSGNDCDKTGDATVVGEGLYVAGSPQDFERGRQAVWHLHTQAFGTVLGAVELEVCGWLGPWDGTVTHREDRTSGFGPACGASKGHHGMGEIRDAAGVPILKLMDLGWKDAVGGVLAVTGKYQQYYWDGTKQQKFGTVTAQLLASVREACLLAEHGAQHFFVFGTYEFLNTGSTKPPKVDKEPLFPKECKDTDPNQDKIKDTTEKRECPTARK